MDNILKKMPSELDRLTIRSDLTKVRIKNYRNYIKDHPGQDNEDQWLDILNQLETKLKNSNTVTSRSKTIESVTYLIYNYNHSMVIGPFHTTQRALAMKAKTDKPVTQAQFISYVKRYSNMKELNLDVDSVEQALNQFLIRFPCNALSLDMERQIMIHFAVKDDTMKWFYGQYKEKKNKHYPHIVKTLVGWAYLQMCGVI